MLRVRVRFAKLGKVRFTSHRDVARMFERAVRRAELPVALTQGFTPRPRVAFGLALSTGHESLAEYLDIDFVQGEVPIDVAGLPGLLSGCLPVGIDVVEVAELDAGTASLQHEVALCSWELELIDLDVDDAVARVAAALAAPSLLAPRTRKGVEALDDLRPGIVALAAGPLDQGAGVLVRAELATQPRGLRPAELLDAVFPGATAQRVLRTHQWIVSDGERREPLPLRMPAPLPAGAGG